MDETNHHFERTVCACHSCKACCKRQPGPLASGDFERLVTWREEQGFDRDLAEKWVKDHLWASPGCIVKNGLGETKRIGTITPRYKKGKCVFLTADERCSIHEVAPFGCAFFDTHMSWGKAHTRSNWLAYDQQNPEYQKLRNELPYATHHKPLKYDL